MASEYAKKKALMKRLKETKRPIPNFGLGLSNPVDYVENIKDIYDNTDDQIKPFNNLDKTTYASDPIQQRKLKDEKLFQNILPRLKNKGQRALKKKPVANNFDVDVTALSGDFNNYLEMRKELEKSVMPPKIKEPKAEPKEEGGLHSVLETDLLYRRKKGLDF